MKNIIITGGPTNEYIDEVMKITNMSTGSLSISLAKYFLEKGWVVTLIINRSVSIKSLDTYIKERRLILHPVETTDEMLTSLKEVSIDGLPYDLLIHAAAVGDYKADFTFLMEELASDVFDGFKEGRFEDKNDLLAYLKNGTYRIDNDSKISSYQDGLTVKLALTPKIISKLREWYPNSTLVACKLLENVAKEELFEVAQHLAKKNKVDYILANDLNDLRLGRESRYLVNQNGYMDVELKSPSEICNYLHERI